MGTDKPAKAIFSEKSEELERPDPPGKSKKIKKTVRKDTMETKKDPKSENGAAGGAVEESGPSQHAAQPALPEETDAEIVAKGERLSMLLGREDTPMLDSLCQIMDALVEGDFGEPIYITKNSEKISLALFGLS